MADIYSHPSSFSRPTPSSYASFSNMNVNPAHLSAPSNDDQIPLDSSKHGGQPSATDYANASAKTEAKPQATFLTKLYALLERPEYQSMIRWDSQGEQIIVEKPEQLALHVLPSIYRQSRFASFSRQLNIYGFMRKVNLRNVDPAIEDPDASTWSHPTLNRWSTPDVIANFKRRVPPRVPKPRKRDDPPLPSVQPPTLPSHHTLPSSSSLHNGHAHTQYADTLKMPSLGGLSIPHTVGGGRARGFSAPNLTSSGYINGSSNGGSAYFPSPSNGNGGRYTNPSPYPRVPLPPLSMPSHHQGPHHSQQPHHSQHPSHPLTPTDDLNSPSLYNPRSADPYNTAGFSYQQDQPLPQIGQNQWSYLSPGPPSSLSSILNPQSQHNSSSNSYTRPTISALTLSTNFPSYSANGGHGTSSHSPQYAGGSPTDSSRPTTGYSAISHSSVSSSSFDTQLSPIHFSSSGGRPLTPTTSSSNNSSSLAIRRKTSISNHHNSHSPYPSPSDSRPNTSYHSQTQPFAYDSSWNDGRPSSAVAVSRTPNEHPQSQAAQHFSPDFSFLHMSDAMSGVQRDDHSNGVAYSHEGSMERSASGGSNASDGSAYIGGE